MGQTESFLRKLFDFQRFAGNKRLDEMIRAAEEAETGRPLEDSEMNLNAAGETDVRRLKAEEDETL